jgi:hypothetical protein
MIMYKIVDLSPDYLDEDNINIGKLKSSLSEAEYLEFVDEDGALIVSEIVEQYGLDYIPNTTWVKVTKGEKTIIEYTSHDILGAFSCPSQYEAPVYEIISNRFILESMSIAGGQSGGFCLSDLESDWSYSTQRFVSDDVLWVENKELIIVAEDFSSYGSSSTGLLLLKMSGEMGRISLCGKNNFSDDEPFNPGCFINHFMGRSSR